MTTTTTNVAPRWLVITPTLTIEHWLEAIRVGAAASGLRVTVDGFGLTFDETLDRPDIIVTDEVARALASGAVSIAVIVPDSGSAADAIETNGQDGATAVLSASRHMAEVSSLDANHLVIGSDQLRTEGAQIQVFPDLIISVPKAVSGSQDISTRSAKADILRDMYAQGRVSDQGSFTWPVEIFAFHPTALVEGRPGEFDLTGRPKFLVSGPYLWMPAGTWTARIRFSIDNGASKRRFRLDWGSITEWTEQHCTPEHSGMYEMELTHTFAQPESCEIRFLITEGCFSGRANFEGATIRRAPSPSQV